MNPRKLKYFFSIKTLKEMNQEKNWCKNSFMLEFEIQIFSTFNRASWCVHISDPSCLFSLGNISPFFKSTFTMLSHHPCCVFLAPIAITGTWGPYIAGSFLCISLESIQLLWFYLEVSALHIWFPETVWIVFLRNLCQSGCEQLFSEGSWQ